MEQSTIQWLGAPSCLRGSFAFYKSVGCKQESGGATRVWELGEFYFMRCGPQEPVCIAEVTLLWEDQTQRRLLASSRLYFLPEDTPKGRAVEHGEDEVIAVSKKIVVRVEDLVKWTCQEPPQWKHSSPDIPGSDGSQDASSPQEGKTEGDDEAQQKVKVLSYPQYCRFRSLQSRVPDQAICPGLQDPHLLALGGIKAALRNTRVLYCRDTFNHPTLDSNASILTQLGCTSLSLKGRPRKRKGRDDQQNNNHLSESWMERMKENVMGSVEMHWDGNWLPHPEEQLFLDQLFIFMERRGSPISKVPNLGFKKIDLFLMYSVVKRLGGYERVTSHRLWKTVYNELGGSPGSTSAATCTRRHYERLMLPYELYVRGENPELGKPRATSFSPATIKKTVRGRAVSNSPKKNAVTNQASLPDGGVVVVRKRGRPPGKRNAKVLARGRVGRPPLHPKPPSEQPERPHQEIGQPLTIFQELKLANHQHGQGLSLVPSNMVLHQPALGRDVKTETAEPQAPSFLSVPCKLLAGGSLEGFSPTKGLCPLDLFRARLGLNGVSAHEVDSSTPHQTIMVHQPKVETPESLQHQCSGCSLDATSQNGGLASTRAPLPPLRILPLDIGCSLQLRQLMRTRLGSTHMNTFTKRLSEVLAQDLGKTSQPNGSAPQDQSLPLNLSKRAITKRSAGDTEFTELQGRDVQSMTKRPKVETEDLGASLKWSFPVPSNQDEPADLSSPSRARALAQDRTNVALTLPEATCFSLVPKLEENPYSIGASPCVYHMTQVEDKTSVSTVTVKKEPESANLEPQSNSDLYSQCVPTDDLKESDAVSSLKVLSSSLLSKPSSC
ncbi:AT-rich interactive domain-containing protein 5B [Pimephales promelas]|uniref:AT-rich interactive domain-containing protein 5B n=1 Tax=Pimephales promelas TaxID=90988 RepID=UPI001955B013|nr:AT-rich interactive domain-containing protein 5B [Pimephales promelas]KAG1969959.1 AT-rich interactive domain-containing protein 5B [Pimephales promelas]